MIDEIVVTCVGQKEIFLTKILNLSKRIEVRCRQEDVNLDDFVEQRQDCIDRINKCDVLMEKKLLEMENIEEREHLNAIIKGKCLPEACYTEQEIALLEAVLRCKTVAKEIVRLNSSAMKMLSVKCKDVREKINEVRSKQVEQQEIFHG